MLRTPNVCNGGLTWWPDIDVVGRKAGADILWTTHHPLGMAEFGMQVAGPRTEPLCSRIFDAVGGWSVDLGSLAGTGVRPIPAGARD